MNFTERNTAAETARNIPSIKSSGNSPRFAEVTKAGYKAAKTMFPVLLTGETGTGKEVFANAIHNNGEHAGKAVVSINCVPPFPMTFGKVAVSDNERGCFHRGEKGRQKGKI